MYVCVEVRRHTHTHTQTHRLTLLTSAGRERERAGEREGPLQRCFVLLLVLLQPTRHSCGGLWEGGPGARLAAGLSPAVISRPGLSPRERPPSPTPPGPDAPVLTNNRRKSLRRTHGGGVGHRHAGTHTRSHARGAKKGGGRDMKRKIHTGVCTAYAHTTHTHTHGDKHI